MPDPSPSPLADSASPFLRHGAAQPVEWLPWSEEAFERAERENRPVLLDIGAVWCHWCHVMDHESYEDPETAELINGHFVPVKVDRDERPDVDARYQRAVQALSGQGGWPLTAFLTPDGEPFYGGTYFPPEDRHGRPSFRRVLGEIARVWRDKRESALDSAATVRERLAGVEEQSAAAGSISPALVEAGEEVFAEQFDFRHGGFGGAPKFPNPGAIELLLGRHLDAVAQEDRSTARKESGRESSGRGGRVRGEDDWRLRVVTQTLAAMGRGGVYDQLGGGFHRYSVDARWLVPHFEKMAYDNGPLLQVYARAYAVTGEALFRRVGEGILDHYDDVAPDLLAEGGFPASQDADVGPEDDGSYWTWTQEEIRDAVGRNDPLLRTAVLRYGLEDSAAAMHEDPSRHVLYLACSVEEVAGRMDVSEAEILRLLEALNGDMKRARSGRPQPYVDRTVYAGWTALVASGFIAAARFFDRDDAGAAAIRALERIAAEAFRPGVGVRRRVGAADADAGDVFLEDQAFVAQAYLDAFELTQREEWLQRARDVGGILLDRFLDADSGAFADRPVDAASGIDALNRIHRPITDSPTPSGNAVGALVLLRLAVLLHRPDLREAAERALSAFAGFAERMPTAMATYLRAVDLATAPATTVVIVGPKEDGLAEGLLASALSVYRPRLVVRRLAPGAAASAEQAGEPPVPAAVAAMMESGGDGAARAYVCTGETCAPPTGDPEELRTLLEGGAASF